MTITPFQLFDHIPISTVLLLALLLLTTALLPIILPRRRASRTHAPNALYPLIAKCLAPLRHQRHTTTAHLLAVPPYRSRRSLCTPTETIFYQALRRALPHTYIAPKVRLEDIISADHLPHSERHTARNYIKSRHVDFIACPPRTLEILFAIELDDPSHDRDDRHTADLFLNAALAAAAIPLYRFPVAPSYEPALLASRLPV
jgi:hypothetical protein